MGSTNVGIELALEVSTIAYFFSATIQFTSVSNITSGWPRTGLLSTDRYHRRHSSVHESRL